jgi:hypothetical protein
LRDSVALVTGSDGMGGAQRAIDRVLVELERLTVEESAATVWLDSGGTLNGDSSVPGHQRVGSISNGSHARALMAQDPK